MPFRSLLLCCVLFALPHWSLRAQTQPESPPSPPFITGQIGLGVLNVPRYPGSDERWVLPVPIIDLRIARRIYVGGSASGLATGAGIVLVETRSLSWTADFSLMANRPEDRTPALAGMGDRGFGAFAGTSLTYRLGILQLTGTAARGVEDRMGAVATLGASLNRVFARRWFTQLGGTSVFGDCDNVAWDFAVTEEQAARRSTLLQNGEPGLEPGDDVPYEPECGLKELRASGSVAYVLNTRISLVALGSATRLEGGAADSPLTRQRTGWEAGLALTWRF